MKPIYHLILMLITAWVAILIKDIVFENRIYGIFSLGQTLVPFAFAAIIMFIGFILQWLNRSKWPPIIKISWTLLVLALFFIYYGEISM